MREEELGCLQLRTAEEGAEEMVAEPPATLLLLRWTPPPVRPPSMGPTKVNSASAPGTTSTAWVVVVRAGVSCWGDSDDGGRWLCVFCRLPLLFFGGGSRPVAVRVGCTKCTSIVVAVVPLAVPSSRSDAPLGVTTALRSNLTVTSAIVGWRR